MCGGIHVNLCWDFVGWFDKRLLIGEPVRGLYPVPGYLQGSFSSPMLELIMHDV